MASHASVVVAIWLSGLAHAGWRALALLVPLTVGVAGLTAYERDYFRGPAQSY